MNFVLGTLWMVLPVFTPEDTTSMFSKINLKCGLISPIQISSGLEKSAFLDVVIWLSLCIVRTVSTDKGVSELM